MLHPVGPLPARVYWRRRVVVLVVLLAVLGGGGWGAVRLLDRPGAASFADAAVTAPVPTPALERVLPSVDAVRTPEAAPTSSVPTPRTTPAAATGAAPPSAGPKPGGPCTDDMLRVTVRAPKQVRAGSSPTLRIVVRNVSTVPCVRRLDAELQEVVLRDARGSRIWGSNDCHRERSNRRATLAPGQAVALDVVWSGLSSAKGCAAPRRVPAPGVYVLRGRLGGAVSAERRIRLS